MKEPIEQAIQVDFLVFPGFSWFMQPAIAREAEQTSATSPSTVAIPFKDFGDVAEAFHLSGALFLRNWQKRRNCRVGVCLRRQEMGLALGTQRRVR